MSADALMEAGAASHNGSGGAGSSGLVREPGEELSGGELAADLLEKGSGSQENTSADLRERTQADLLKSEYRSERRLLLEWLIADYECELSGPNGSPDNSVLNSRLLALEIERDDWRKAYEESYGNNNRLVEMSGIRVDNLVRERNELKAKLDDQIGFRLEAERRAETAECDHEAALRENDRLMSELSASKVPAVPVVEQMVEAAARTAEVNNGKRSNPPKASPQNGGNILAMDPPAEDVDQNDEPEAERQERIGPLAQGTAIVGPVPDGNKADDRREKAIDERVREMLASVTPIDSEKPYKAADVMALFARMVETDHESWVAEAKALGLSQASAGLIAKLRRHAGAYLALQSLGDRQIFKRELLIKLQGGAR